MITSGKSNDPFISEYIPKVSRTFALAIGFLPPALRKSVFASYLLCRVADTLEDSPFLETDEKEKKLRNLSSVLENAARGKGIAINDLEGLGGSIGGYSGDDHRLLGESFKLFEILERLPDAHRPIIYRWAGEMARGMAEYTRLYRVDDDEIAALKDVKDWDRYCYYVAGTVGRMMTELFIEHYDLDSKTITELVRLGNSFGLGLQKVNVIKDVPDDRKRGVCYLPFDLLSKHGLKPSDLKDGLRNSAVRPLVTELSGNAMGHLDDAVSYTILIPRGYRGVRMFLLVPILLAIETLNLIMENPGQSMSGPPMKLDRRTVSKLVAAAATSISSNKAIKEYYLKLRTKNR